MSRPLPISNVPLNRLHKYRTAGWWCRPMGRSTPIRLPAVYPYRHFVAAGGLMSYGIDYVKHLTCEAECLW